MTWYKSLTFDFKPTLIIFFIDELVAKLSSNYYNGGSDSYSLVIRKVDNISSDYTLGRIPLKNTIVTGYLPRRSGTTLSSSANGYTKLENNVFSWYVKVNDTQSNLVWYGYIPQMNNSNTEYVYLGL